ncbi:MAG: thioredoxin family protein [Chromatiales bacterium]|nr:thioredoxin family protein [Chromatiales bacterium]
MGNGDGMTVIEDVEGMQAFIMQNEAAALYFAGANCGVCQVLEPKVRSLLSESFPRVAFARVATEQATELAAQQSVFAVPTLLLFFDGRESFRYARNFSVGEIERDITRPYSMMFE